MRFFVLLFTILALVLSGITADTKFPRAIPSDYDRRPYSLFSVSDQPIVRSYINDKKHGKGLHIDVDVEEFLKRRSERV